MDKTNTQLMIIIIELLFLKLSEGFISPDDYWEHWLDIRYKFDKGEKW